MRRKRIEITGADAEALKALGIDPAAAEDADAATDAKKTTKRPDPTEDDPRGLAKLQDLMREWRPNSEIRASHERMGVPIRSSYASRVPDLKVGPVSIDVDHVPRQGDVILVSAEARHWRGREYRFALVKRIVATGGANVMFWEPDLQQFWHHCFRITSSELKAPRDFKIEGIIRNPDVLRSPLERGERIFERLVTEQRAAAEVPRLSGRQGCHDDRIRQEFIVTLDCEAIPKVGDVIVTRWHYSEGLQEQVDVLKEITANGRLELEAYYGGDLSFVSSVEPWMIQRLDRPYHVLIEGVVRNCEQGDLPTTT